MQVPTETEEGVSSLGAEVTGHWTGARNWIDSGTLKEQQALLVSSPQHEPMLGKKNTSLVLKQNDFKIISNIHFFAVVHIFYQEEL